MKPLKLTVPLDYQPAPITGWTRKHWEEVFFGLIKGVLASASAGGARIHLAGPQNRYNQLEGFARSFIMVGPWLRTSKIGMITVAGETINIARFYQQGLLAGTDPNHPEYWGEIGDRSQQLVECASLAWSLYLSQAHIWDQFSPIQKQQIASYLFQCTQVRSYRNNWLLFNVIVNTVLKLLGMPYAAKQIEENLRACNEMYLGDGWYQDGESNQIDYYNLWAFHYYHLIWVILDGDSQPAIARVHRQRMSLLMQNFRYFFAGDGSIPCFGRSAIYRFAYLGPIVLGQYLNCLGLDAGEVKTMCHLTMQFFGKHEILSDRHHLSLGYLRPCAAGLDAYSCGGSPYWAAKAFNIFLLPESDPFWQTPEKPLVIHQQSFSIAIKSAGFLVIGNQQTGHVQLINQKSYRDLPEFRKKYTNFVYSSIFSYEARSIYKNFNCDNALTFSSDGVRYSQRGKIENLYCVEGFVASKYKLDQPQIKIPQAKQQKLKIKLRQLQAFITGKHQPRQATPPPHSGSLGLVYTSILVKDDFMINVHRIETNESLILKEGGYPLGFDDGEAEVLSILGAEAACKDGKISFLRNLSGYTQQFKAQPFYEDMHGSNIRYRQSIVPALGFENRGQQVFYLACMVYGTTGETSIEALMQLVTDFRIDQGIVHITFNDGEKAVIQLGEIQYLDLNLNGQHVHGKVVMARVSAEGKSAFILDKG